MTSPVWRVRAGRSSLGLACVTMGLLSALLSADAAAQSTALVPWRPGNAGSFQADTLEERASVAILDIGLPGMDGYQLARRLREAFGRQIVLIALTGATVWRPTLRRRCRRASTAT
jgi:DNA-binding response OmpR family regulator